MYCLIQLSQILPGLVMAAQLLMALAILIILHEAGHFFAARFFGIRVEKFFLFFDAWGFKLFHFKKGDTEYGMGWLPLGGYVKIAGMIDESMDTEQMALPPKEDEFRSKPAWQRLIVMLGGVTVNLILGVVIYWVLNLTYGHSYINISKWKDGIVPGKAYREIGIMPGDKILKVGNKPVLKESDLRSSDMIYGNLDLLIDRQGKEITVHIPSKFSAKADENNMGDYSFIPRFRPIVDSLEPSRGGFRAGLKKGDQIVGINNKKTEYYDELQESLKNYKNQKVNLSIIRDHNEMVLPVQLDSAGKIGFYPNLSIFKSDTEYFGFFPALGRSIPMAFGAIGEQAKGLGKLVKGEVNPNKVSGMVGVAKVFGGSFDGYNFWRITGFLSMILAFFNILPIPALDGGHVLFLVVEMVRGKPLNDKFLENAQIVGFFILIGLMILINGHDILKNFIH